MSGGDTFQPATLAEMADALEEAGGELCVNVAAKLRARHAEGLTQADLAEGWLIQALADEPPGGGVGSSVDGLDEQRPADQ